MDGIREKQIELRKQVGEWVGNYGRGGQAELVRLSGVSRNSLSSFIAGGKLSIDGYLALARVMEFDTTEPIKDPLVDVSQRLRGLADFLVNSAWTRDDRLKELTLAVRGLNESLDAIAAASKTFTNGGD